MTITEEQESNIRKFLKEENRRLVESGKPPFPDGFDDRFIEDVRRGDVDQARKNLYDSILGPKEPEEQSTNNQWRKLCDLADRIIRFRQTQFTRDFIKAYDILSTDKS